MSSFKRTSLHRRPGQSYWDRMREIDAILAARSTVTDTKRATIRAWLANDPRSAKPRTPR